MVNKLRKYYHKSPATYAYHRAMAVSKVRCNDCGLFGCMCQSSLLEFAKTPRIRRNRYSRCRLYLCDCSLRLGEV
jgi:hypothetical protein